MDDGSVEVMLVNVRLLLVDENDDFLEGLSAWVAKSPRFQVVGVAHSGNEAIERIGKLAPDLVLMNMTLPDLSGLETTRRITTRPGAPFVVLMTFHDSSAARAEAQAAGAEGCLSKPEIMRGEFFLVLDTLLRTRTGRPGSPGIIEMIVRRKQNTPRGVEQ